MFAIIRWEDPKSVRFVPDEDGSVRLFETHAEAESFAESELHSNWMIVEL